MAPRAMPTDLSAELSTPELSTPELSTPELLREALDESKELVRLELKLAQEELREDVRKLKGAGILLVIAGALFIIAMAMFDVALVFALGGTASAALIVAFIVLGEVAIVGFIGYRQLPKVPLERTRSRWATDVRALKEQVT
jgi:uncharacterized membrane protein YuzA (DUF378 family)